MNQHEADNKQFSLLPSIFYDAFGIADHITSTGRVGKRTVNVWK
jgi:hypothetical protein